MTYERHDKPKFPNKLNKRGREIRKLLKRYEKPYWWRANTELKTQSTLKCNECNGDLIEVNSYATCTTCGLQNFPIFQTEGIKQSTENNFQKQLRQERLPNKQIKSKPDLVNVKILRSISEKMKNYLNQSKKPKYAWICEAILTKIDEELKYA